MISYSYVIFMFVYLNLYSFIFILLLGKEKLLYKSNQHSQLIKK